MSNSNRREIFIIKKTFYSEYAYVLGVIFLALGTAFMKRADFGMSMVVAPAFLCYLKGSAYFSWFSFGMAEYCFQAILIIVLSLGLRRFKLFYLFSFVTAVVYGITLDAISLLVDRLPADLFAYRILFFLVGVFCCCVGVALFFHTYFAPEAYELIVKEITQKTGRPIAVVKTTYDMCSLTLGVILSFCFFGFMHFEGVKLGTLITAITNGWIIGRFSSAFDRYFEFKDRFELRKYFS